MNHSSISNLPRGMGAVLGIFARNSFLVQYARWKVIGVSISDLNVFSNIHDSTDTVMDVTLRLSKMDFTVDESALANIHGAQKFESGIYKVPFFMTGTKLSTDDFAPALKVVNPSVILSTLYAPADGLRVCLYIRKICGVSSEEINKSYISEIEEDVSDVVPVAASGKPLAKVYYKVTDKGISEDLDFFFDGPEEEFEAFKQMMCETVPQMLRNVVG